MTQTKPLATWLQTVIDERHVHDRARWASLLGVSRQAVGQWLNGRDLPGADKLDLLLTIVRQNHPKTLRDDLVEWDRLASRPLQEVWPGARPTSATLGHYLAEHLRADLMEALKPLPADDQRDICTNALYECTDRRLRDQRATAPITQRTEQAPPARQMAVAREPASIGEYSFRLLERTGELADAQALNDNVAKRRALLVPA